MEKQIIFFDKIGRLIIGDVFYETEKTLAVKNPCVFQVQPTPNRQFNISLLPAVLFEQLNIAETTNYNVTYNKDNIEILTDDYGAYIKPAENFLNNRKQMFDKLVSGDLRFTQFKGNKLPDLEE